MACTLPPELDNATLLAYLDGEAEPEVAVHLEECPHCRARAQRLAGVQGRLTAALYRVTCPSPMELGEYHLGVLGREQAAAVEQHLAECPHCSREVAQLKDYLGELAADVGFRPLERLKVLVAELVGGGEGIDRPRRTALAPAYAGIRGEEEGPRMYQAGEVQIVLEIQQDTEQPDRRTVLGLATGLEANGWEVQVWRGEERIADVPVDELGNFVLRNLAPGSYELNITGPEVTIQIQDLDLGRTQDQGVPG
jgi:hypothetical protein